MISPAETKPMPDNPPLMPIDETSGRPVAKLETTGSKSELEPKIREKLSTLWGGLFLGNNAPPPESAQQSDANLTAWMSETLKVADDQLIDEWHIDRHPELIEKLQTASASERPDLQRQYIHAITEEIFALKERQAPGDPHWDSWPANMRANNRMNCVGHTMLVSRLLQSAGISVYAGRPINHTLPVARLDNGDWWLVDSHNGPTQVRQIYPQETVIAGNRALLLDDPAFDGKVIPIDTPDSLAISAVGNMNALQHDATDKFEPNVAHKEQARTYLDEHAAALGDFSFDGLDEILAPQRQAVRETPEMQAEGARISVLHNPNYDRHGRRYLRSLPREQAKAVLLEAAQHSSEMMMYLSGVTDELPTGSSELQQYAANFRQGTRLLQGEHPEMLHEFIVRTATWWAEMQKYESAKKTSPTTTEIDKPRD